MPARDIARRLASWALRQPIAIAAGAQMVAPSGSIRRAPTAIGSRRGRQAAGAQKDSPVYPELA